MHRPRPHATPPLLCLALLLAGCGGGDASTNGSVASQSGLTAATIAPIAGGVTLALDGLVNDAIGTAAEIKTTATGAAITPASGKRGLIGATLALLSQAAADTGAIATGAAVSAACPGGGTIAIDGSFLKAGQLSAGDHLSISASHCAIDGETLSGKVDIDIAAIAGMPGATGSYSATLRASADKLVEEFSDETITFNGDLQLKIDQTDAANIEIIASGNLLSESHLFTQAATAVGASTASKPIDVTLKNFLLDVKLQGDSFASASQTLLSNFEMSSIALGAQGITVKGDPKALLVKDKDPKQGYASAHLTLSDGTVEVDVIALGGGRVRLDYYPDPSVRLQNGRATTSVTTTWAALRTAATQLASKS